MLSSSRPSQQLTIQQSPYIIKRHGPRVNGTGSIADSDSGYESPVARARPRGVKQQRLQVRPLSPPHPSHPRRSKKPPIAHPKSTTLTFSTGSPHVVKRARSRVSASGSSVSHYGSGASDEVSVTPPTLVSPYGRTSSKTLIDRERTPVDRSGGSGSRTPVSPTATQVSFHTAHEDEANSDECEGTQSGPEHAGMDNAMQQKPVERIPYEYPSPPASLSIYMPGGISKAPAASVVSVALSTSLESHCSVPSARHSLSSE